MPTVSNIENNTRRYIGGKKYQRNVRVQQM